MGVKACIIQYDTNKINTTILAFKCCFLSRHFVFLHYTKLKISWIFIYINELPNKCFIKFLPRNFLKFYSFRVMWDTTKIGSDLTKLLDTNKQTDKAYMEYGYILSHVPGTGRQMTLNRFKFAGDFNFHRAISLS